MVTEKKALGISERMSAKDAAQAYAKKKKTVARRQTAATTLRKKEKISGYGY